MNEILKLIAESTILQYATGATLIILTIIIGIALIKGNNVISDWFRKKFNLYTTKDMDSYAKYYLNNKQYLNKNNKSLIANWKNPKIIKKQIL